MRSTVPMLVNGRVPPGGHWQRFAAALCFVGYYQHFVNHGRQLWESPRALLSVTEHANGVLLGICFLLLGRSLWRGRGSVRFWSWATLGISLVALGISAVALACAHGQYGTQGPGGLTPLWRLQLFVGLNLDHFIFACLLLSARVIGRGHLPGYSGWVVLAVAWCGVWLLLTFWNLLGLPSDRWSGAAEWYSCGWPVAWVGLAGIALLAALAASLLLGWRLARALSIAYLVTEAVQALRSAWVLSLLVWSAIEALMHSTAGNPRNPFPWPLILLNQYSFEWVGLRMVVQCAPFVLIAWYARHVPMKMIPDDGSPFPRRYCGACGYNLHGIEAGRCPECGMPLPDGSPVAETPPVQAAPARDAAPD